MLKMGNEDLNETIKIEEEHLKNVAQFVNLGCLVPDSVKDAERRIGLALSAIGRLRKLVWSNRDIQLRLKVRLYQVLILAIAICVSETWALPVALERKLLVFKIQCLRSMLTVSRLNRMQ